MIKNSNIYEGKVVHKRFKPKYHYFKYNVFSLFLDLDEINLIQKKIKIFSNNSFNILSFCDKDHGPRDGSNLKNWVIENLKSNNIKFENIKVKLLCYPRIFGYVFNPLSIFFVYDNRSKIIAVLYEVKNTFGEQHTYIFKVEDENIITNSCDKKFFVSPFIEMKSKYSFRIIKPEKKLSVSIDQSDMEGKLLYASQDGVAKEINNKNMLLSYISHPLMTFKVIAAIHFEALKLWLKGVKLVKKKINLKNNITFEKK
ncbi:DUF1365 domain-containing protein [Candidatus Pelagibacter sp.]|nr:DUF1365 domain-containing protein [Candidatus Pelagibacter sp.]